MNYGAEKKSERPFIITDYKAKESSMTERYEKASTRLAKVGKDIAVYNAKRSELEGFLKLLEGRGEMLTEFDESLWLGIVHQMKVISGNEFTFGLKDVSEAPLAVGTTVGVVHSEP